MQCLVCSTTSSKLLRCTHSICDACIDENTGTDGTIKCIGCDVITPPPPPGMTQTQALPNSYAMQDSATLSTAGKTQVECNECVVYDPKPATHTCLDCTAHLCNTHAEGHKISKCTFKHQLVPVDSSSGDVQATLQQVSCSCPLHPTHYLTEYCQQCKMVVCDKCAASRTHLDHKTDITSIQNAAVAVRAGLESEVRKLSGEDSEGAIEQNLTKVTEVIQALHDGTESISEEITMAFDDVVKTLRTRQQQLIDELDALRHTKLVPLEEQARCLRESQESAGRIALLLAACSDNVDLLKMSSWLRDALEKIDSVPRTDREPVSTNDLQFYDSGLVKVKAMAEMVGAVIDVGDVDSCKSTLTCGDVRVVGEDIPLTVTAQLINGQPVLGNVVVVEVKTPSESVEELPLEADTDTLGTLKTSYQPLAQGQHQFSATIASRHLQNSPHIVTVNPSYSFNPAMCHQGIALYNGNKTARFTGRSEWQAVLSRESVPPSNGTIRVRIDNLPTADPNGYVALCNQESPNLQYPYTQPGLFGWCAHDTNKKFCGGGGDFGKQWQPGDIIGLTYNGAEGTLTGVFERTGKTEVLRNVSGECRLCVNQYYQTSQYTIL